MISLFLPEPQRLLESYCFTNTLFAFDFDGTLAKIVSRPEDARMSAEISREFERLCRHASVAVISGRSRADVLKRLPGKPDFVVGNHGFEGLAHFSPLQLEPLRQVAAKWRTQLGKSLKGIAGLEIEDKEFSLAVHYRKSRAKNAAKLSILKASSALKPPPRLVMGKCVVNLIPTGAPHKGVALLELMSAVPTKTALYVGDDHTDEDIFALPHEGILTVRVGSHKDSAASFYLSRQSEILRLLKFLNSRMAKKS